MFNLIKEFFLFTFIIVTTILVGPIFKPSYYYLINAEAPSKNVKSCRCIITITIGLIDSVLYGISLYLSIQTINQLQNQQQLSNKEIVNYHKQFQSIIIEEKQLLQPINETIEILIKTQTNLNDLIKDLVNDNHTDEILIQNTLGKLTTLEYLQNDSIMTIKNNIHESLQLLNLNVFINRSHQQLHDTYFNNSRFSNSYLFNRINFFIFTFSFLLYIQQIILWFCQYLTLKNPQKYFSYSFILSIIILSQSSGLIYFIEITKAFHYRSPLYIYICIFFIRSFVTIYQCCFSVY